LKSKPHPAETLKKFFKKDLTKTNKSSIIIIEREREVQPMRDRERFEARAIECGATIIRSERTVLTVEANNGKMTTTYTFTEDGTFKNISTIWA
jgi:hypothetical protein